MKYVREHIDEKFRQNSDPIEDMGIGIKSWLDKVEIFCNQEIFGNQPDTDIFIEIAYDKLKELFILGVAPEKAADMCYDDINIYNEWAKQSMHQYYGEPEDDLKANCRDWQYEDPTIENVDQLARYLIDRYPNHDKKRLWQMVANWIGYEEHIDEKFVQDSDPIYDLGIGSSEQFKKLFDLFAKEDKEKYIYTIAPYDGNHIDFWFSNPTIIKLTQNQIDNLFDYVKDILYDNLGFRYILTNPKLIMGYRDREITKKGDPIPMIVRFNIHEKFKNILSRGEYRRVEPYKNEIKFYDNILNSKRYVDMVEQRTYVKESKSMNEKFTQDSDPIKDMNIGIDPEMLKKLDLDHRYEAASTQELFYIKKFFKASKNEIYYLGGYFSGYTDHLELIQKIIKEKTTQLIIKQNFNDKFGNQVFYGYQTSIGKISITTSGKANWFICDANIIMFLYSKFGKEIFMLI